jgi:hypothetical protein
MDILGMRHNLFGAPCCIVQVLNECMNFNDLTNFDDKTID